MVESSTNNPVYPCVLTEAFKQETISEDTFLVGRTVSNSPPKPYLQNVTTDANYVSIDSEFISNFG